MQRCPHCREWTLPEPDSPRAVALEVIGEYVAEAEAEAQEWQREREQLQAQARALREALEEALDEEHGNPGNLACGTPWHHHAVVALALAREVEEDA